MTDSMFKAISDPTRRYLLEQILVYPKTVGQIANGLPISRPAVSQHLKALRDANLVLVQSSGTRRFYSVNKKAFQPLQHWVNRLYLE